MATLNANDSGITINEPVDNLTDSKPNAILHHQELSSSSDTYISDIEETNCHSKHSNRHFDHHDNIMNSFDRNFEINDSEVNKTIQTLKIDDDEFSFITSPKSSPKDAMKYVGSSYGVEITPSTDINTNNFNQINHTPNDTNINDDDNNNNHDNNHNPHNNLKNSPNKSIMKKTPTSSPKKNVVFNSAIPEIIHYHENSFDDNDQPQDDNKIKADQEFSDKIEKTLNHQWNLVKQHSNTSSISDDVNDTIPPIPPPHGVNLNQINVNYQDTLKQNDLDNEKDESFKQLNKKETLHRFKLNSDKISLNEKLGIFLHRNQSLTKNQQANPNVNVNEYDDHNDNEINNVDTNENFQSQTDDLDQHLSNLDNLNKYQTDLNIQNLSLNLQDYHSNVENPLNSLSNTNDVPLKSAGSSQSSLQSLLDNNRILQVDNFHQTNKGFELNDGIHGFSNDLVEQLIPQNEQVITQSSTNHQFNNKTLDSDESQILTMPKSNSNRLSMMSVGTLGTFSDNDEYHDSFDNDYNNTEQSIMNLLSAHAPGNEDENHLAGPIGEQSKFVEPIESSIDPNEVPIKQEFETTIKRSPSMEEISIKQEPEDELIPHQPPLPNDTHDIKFEPQSIERPILKSPIDEEFNDDNEIDDSSFEEKQVHRIDIRGEEEHGWKLEYSEDGDREDNDIFTNNDITVVSNQDMIEDQVHTDDLHEDDLHDDDLHDDDLHDDMEIVDLQTVEIKQEVNKESLDINFSPNSSQEIIDSPNRSLAPPRTEDSQIKSPNKSLAPPKVDIGIDATNPPTPIRDAKQQADLLKSKGSPIPFNIGNHMQNRSIVDSSVVKESNSELQSYQPQNNEKSMTEESINEAEIPRKSLIPGSGSIAAVAAAIAAPVASITPVFAARKDKSIDETEDEAPINPVSVETKENNEEINEQPLGQKGEEDLEESSEVLANSTNVAPPEELTLPPIEPTNYSSFEEITKHLNDSKSGGEDEFERSLSAEFDEEKPTKPTNFLSIWHSQEKGTNKNQLSLSRRSLNTSNISIYDPNTNEFKLPNGLSNKKFKEVNVKSRRVVSPNDVDLNVTDFLPELSQDSGFENHLRYMINDANISNVSGNRLSKTPLSHRNILANELSDEEVEGPVAEQNDLAEIEPRRPENEQGEKLNSPIIMNEDDNKENKSIEIEYLKPKRSYKTLKPQVLPKQTPYNEMKKSKFQVPSFEIKRSNSKLNTRDKYNDIFDESMYQDSHHSMTIKSHGMKTLPSMDRDDVQKILHAKRMISQEEYSQLKLVGRKSSVIQDQSDSLSQKASIHNIDYSVNSTPVIDSEVLPYLTTELMKNPQALLSKDQVFHDSDIFTEGTNNYGSRVSSSRDTIIKNPILADDGFESDDEYPNPDPEILQSGNIFKTPPKDDNKKSPDSKGKLGKFGSPIKITSPIKLVKKGSTVTSIVLDPKNSSNKLQQLDLNNENNIDNKKEFQGNELVNNKVRGDERLINGTVNNSESTDNKPSMVSVPSMYTSNTEPSSTSSRTLLNHSKNPSNSNTWKHHSTQPSVIRENIKSGNMERGRLFFRVVGLKNINLPDLADHNGEFSVTLDNGVHCIKTPSYKVKDSRVLIGKEFELMVGESLEFILTMKMNYEKPKGKLVEVKERKIMKSKSKIGRLFGSKDVVTTTKFVPSDPVDTWATKLAPDGSFARCYVDLDQYESKITCKSNSFDIPCFNEWETIETKSGPIKGKPYIIGNLEVKMLYIPRTELHESLPTSIKSAYEVIDQILEESKYEYEGYMNQDGGDCESWKRRFFKLKGTSLIALSEFSHKTRAKINLSKVIDVIYIDKDNNPDSKNMTQKVTRHFSDVLLVPESFKIKFANGEIIDFGAPSMDEKFKWITFFEKISQHNRYRRLPWVKAMLEDLSNKTNNPFFNPETKEFQ